MTVFNGGRFLEPAVESILRQSWGDFEFVIVDDASGDGSVEALNSFAAKDRRVRLFCNAENTGQTACLNQGLREARGEWIARQDADDLSSPRRLEAQCHAVADSPDIVLLGVNGRIINEAGACMGLIHAPLTDAGIRWALPFRNPFIHTGVLFRRCRPDGTVVQYNPDYRICQDWELWARLAGEGRVANLEERLVFYRHSPRSLSNQFSERTREENRRVVAEIWKNHFPARPLSPAEADLLENFREGLRPETWGMFESFYSEARAAWCGVGRARDGQAEAVHFLQAAGALAGRGKLAACSAVMRAGLADPAWTLRVLFQRFCG